MTPRLLKAVFEARNRSLDRAHNQNAWLAWHVAVLMRMKKIPKLEKLTVRTKQRHRQSSAEMLAIVTMINAAHGGAVVAKSDA